MSGDVLSFGDWSNNAEMIADVARLGYIGGHTLDLTYGHGNFWTIHEPDSLVTNDIKPFKGLHRRDYTRSLPTNWYSSFDTVVFDPDYRLNGTPDLEGFDERYGIDVPKRWQDRMHDICDGAHNASQCVRPGGYLLVKCQDQIVSGSLVSQERHIEDAVARRCRLVDRFRLRTSVRPQRSQKHARNYSTLLVFERKDRFK